jgi:DNA-directed RNA polymerase specialized sigma24 family protein
MIEFHAGGYDHNAGELLTVLWPYLRGIAFRGYKDEYAYGVKHNLDMLQEIAEQAHGRYGKGNGYPGDKIHVDTLYESPIDGLKTPKESTLPPEEQKLAEILRESLTPEEWEILVVSYGESERDAAASLGMPKTTYRERLARARERARAILDD